MTDGRKAIGRTTFIAICRKLTSGEVKPHACIDYYFNALVYENINIMRRTMERTLVDTDLLKEMKKQATGICEFLEYSYVSHLKHDCADAAHSLKYALDYELPRNCTNRKVTCEQFLAPFKFVDHLRKRISAGKLMRHVEDTLDKCRQKFLELQAHKVRVHVQELRLKEVLTSVRERPPGSVVYVTLDFKMKQLPLRFRETSHQYFVKRKAE